MKIRLENISKSFGSVRAVDHLSLEIEQGQLVSILGPSGCGKTTTLHILAGIATQDEGRVCFGERCMNGVPTEERNIGLIFQNYALYPHMTARKNLEFPLKMCGLSRGQREVRIRETAEFLDIEDLLERKPAELSGGQQQRVAIARAVVKKPHVLLMDEPFSNLDRSLRVKTRAEIRNLQKKLGITTLFVTHDQEEAASISDRILLMNDGRKIQYGTPKELYYQPEHIFAARFIANARINLLPCRYGDGKLILQNGVIFHFEPQETCPGEVYLYFKPEAVRRAGPEEAKKETSALTLDVTLQSVEILGRDQLVTSLCQGLPLYFFLPSDQELAPGDSFPVRVNPAQMMVFASENGKRIAGTIRGWEEVLC